jgi:hypothetical protein
MPSPAPRPNNSLRFEVTARLVVYGLIGFNALLHLLLIHRYGYHGDELYFIECGRHLAFGYVDHAPMIPWLARIADILGGASLFALRLPAVAAACGTMAMIALLVRKWGGSLRAELVALLCFMLAPAHLRLAAMLDIPVVEVFFCAAASYLLLEAIENRRASSWLFVGGVLGLALLTKHTVLLWIAALGAGLLATNERRVLATAGPWLAAVVALVLFVPNLGWEVHHGFPTLEFAGNLRRDVLFNHGRLLFVLGQLLYFHPLAMPVCIGGVAFALRRPERGMRMFALQFVVLFLAWLALGGKPYYLASAYPALLAAGGIALERWLERRLALFRGFVLALAGLGAMLAVLTLPILDVRTLDRVIGTVLGWFVPPMALTHDLHGELGWDAHVGTVDRVLASLTPNERGRTAILTGSYEQAAALNFFRSNAEPRAVSGHMNYYLWGPEPGRGATLVAYGVPRAWLERHYRSVEERARIDAPLARPWNSDLPVYLCREPLETLATSWPELRRFDHRLQSQR